MDKAPVLSMIWSEKCNHYENSLYIVNMDTPSGNFEKWVERLPERVVSLSFLSDCWQQLTEG